ncbi:MAG: hypothetical protein WBA93_27255 [Microcoleaceae cyanobacterium]
MSTINCLLTEQLSESEVEKCRQKHFNILWAWADSIATEVQEFLTQLKIVEAHNRARLQEQIKAQTFAANQIIQQLEKTLKFATKNGFTAGQSQYKFNQKLFSSKS